MKKLMLMMFVMVLLVGTISAAEWDNKLIYSNNDLKVELKNWFGLGINYGSAELKSHPSINYVKQVGAGKQVVMWYDFNFTEIYFNGLGDIELINVRKGELVERNWKYVYFKEGTCKDIETVNGTINKCSNGEWLDYNLRDIPKGNLRIGVEVEVRLKDHLDIIWAIAGKKIDKHAQIIQVEAHGVSFISSGSSSDRIGARIKIVSPNTSSINIITITKASTVAVSEAYVLNDTDGSILANASFSGDNATFNFELFNDTFYWIVVDDGGASYTFRFGASGGEIAGTFIVWERGGSFPIPADPANLYNVESITVSVSIAPDITLNVPIDNANFTTQSITFNGSVVDPGGISNVSLILDGVFNTTNSSGINNTDYIFTLNISNGIHNWTFEACDTSNNCGNATIRTFTIGDFILNSFTFNASSFETANEEFTINITTNGTTPSSASLIYDGTINTGATITGLGGNDFNITRAITIPVNNGTKSFFFNFTLDGSNQTTINGSQLINATNFTLCTAAPLNIPYLNISFRNETLAQEDITATIASTFVYSLGTITNVNKTLSFSNATENLNYTFCLDPGDRELNIDLVMSYNNDISQQRSFLLTTVLSNVTLNQVLFLLPTSLGLFSPFKTVTINGDTVIDVKAVITRLIGVTTVTITSGFTDGSGFISFFLDPDETYTATFTKVPFAENVFGFNPTADLRTVVLGTGAEAIANGTIITRGTSYVISPLNSTLPNNTIIPFTFNVTSNLTTITFISMNITNSSNVELLFVSNAGVGNLTGTLDTGNNTRLFGKFLIQTAEETISVTRTWIIFTTFAGDYSIFTQFTLAKDNELITEFIRLLIVLSFMAGVLIFMNVGKVIETSESNIAVLLLMTWAFSIVGWLDTGLAVSTTDSGINSLGEFSNQFGIAILLTLPGLFFIFRRLFIRVPR
ncbi:hypothetical protein LCGC14_0546190 [marine sediment metagenome]|uniref:Uncharacterized protein n=1 Tax=marine sediment metagenome TaxID=412755 RepID=A0A0F9RW79_9ZZZZ